MLPLDDPRHGTVAGYGGGCRRSCCQKAMANYENRRRLDQMANRDRLLPRAGAVRRLRALQALGWPSTLLSQKLNRSRNYVSAFTTRTDNSLVRADVYDEIVNLFNELCMTIGPSSLTAARSKAAGWLPPLAVDDFDLDVDEFYPDNKINPVADVDQVVVARAVEHLCFSSFFNKEERRAVVAQWSRTGRSLAELERLSGWNVHRYTAKSADEVAA